MSIYCKISFFINFIIINFFECLDYCGIGNSKYNVKSAPITNNLNNNQQNNLRPIQIYLETKIIESDRFLTRDKLNIIINSLNYTARILQKLIKVKPLNYKITISYSDLNNWGYNNYNLDILKDGNGVEADLVIIIDYINDFLSSSEQKYYDGSTRRPVVGIIYLNYLSFDFNIRNSNYFLESMLLHQFTHILGFYKESYINFASSNGDLNNILTTVAMDVRSSVPRSYIHSPKVMEYAKKYYNCQNLLGVELEDQDGGTNSHWEARILLGEYMNSDHYYPEQVISEFTLALLEDSGWYEVNYFTGGLMRFGKNKKCDFLNTDCTFPSKFKNEFFNPNEIENFPACSSGRQSRVYAEKEKGTDKLEFKDYINYYNRFDNNYRGYYGKDVINADFCLAFNLKKTEKENYGYYVGNCNIGNGNYGAYILYSDNTHSNSELPEILGEKYGDNSFCVLTSLSIKDSIEWYKFDNNIIHPMCFPMYCSEKSLTIKVNEQYVVCPRQGGKVKIDGIYEGFLFCPDYNLICTGTVLCNDMFDCVEKKSEIKTDSYEYDYNEILTTQIRTELIDSTTTVAFELSENSGKCPQYCEQCKDLKKCFKCKNGFNLIGVKENDENPIICDENIDISIGYYQNDNTKVYYPCTEFCKQCNKTHCIKCDNIHKIDIYNNKTCVDKVPNCEIYNNRTFDCIKCKGNYVFLGNNRDNCYEINKSKYYSLDGGISYFPCNEAIEHCDICNNNAINCTKCENNYYFIEENRTHCRNDKDLSEFFSEDDKISYYPCNTNVENCQTCNSRYSCTKCFNNLYLIIINNKAICSNSINDSYYTDNGGQTYYPCNESINFCERCNNKNSCIKCFNNYGFFENYKNICVYLGDNKYYTEDNGNSYYLCSKSLPNCEKCSNKTNCFNCFNGYYFIEYERTRCYNDKNLSKYYTEDEGYSYFLCENNCDTCYNKSICKTCISNFYFIGNNRNKCFKIDIEKYYSNNGGISYLLCLDAMAGCEKCKTDNYCDECLENYYFLKREYNKCFNIDRNQYYYEEDTNSYFPCNTNIANCEECFNDRTCNKCLSPYIILFESPIQCHEESNYINDKTFFKLNESFYEKCSTAMSNCKYCNSIDYCEECNANYYFLNKDHSKCILESSILPKDEYYKVDNKNYYSCSFKEESIDNCKKCTNGTICLQCKDEYAFVSNNFQECISKEELDKKYYHNDDGTMYFPCISNCDICDNNNSCKQCSVNYISIYDDILCEFCEIEIINIQNELKENNEYISNYINSNINKVSKIVHYVNNVYNYTITIFKAWECTQSLLEKDYYKLNTRDLTSQISKKFNVNKENIIYYFMTKNFNNYLEIYDGESGQKLNLNDYCPECINTGFEITNNFTIEMKNELGIVLFEKIKLNEIDVFSKGEPYINDICKNFTISKIDLSISDRRKYLDYANYANEIVCIENTCEIKSKQNSDFIGSCICPIKTDFNKFKNYQINISHNTNEIKSYDISLAIFKCFKSGFSNNILSNTGFYLFLLFIIFQIICFCIFMIFQNKIVPFPKKKIPANPPLKTKDDILFIENLDIIEDSSNINNFRNDIQDIQEKDEGEYIEDFEYDYVGVFDDNSCNTELEDKMSFSNKSNKRNTSKIRDFKAQNTKDVLLENDDDCMSKNHFITKKYKKIDINYNYKLNDKFRDFLTLNKGNKTLNMNGNKNKKHQNKVSETFYLNSEGNKYNKTMNYKIPSEKIIKLKDERKIKTQNENSFKSEEQLYKIKDNINKIKRSILGSAYNLRVKDTQTVENFSFCGFYWYLLGLKQPILNLTSEIKIFRITESFIPSGIKGIRFIFMISLNFFINSTLLSQKYFSKKFHYFDSKYNIRFIDYGTDIPTNERFSYAFKNTIINSVICFAICFVIQSILNYLYFNIRNKINEIIINDHNVEEEIIDYLGTIMKKYKFMFLIDMILMILFFCYMVNFSSIYIGGDLDYISASILTFIFLQIFPFIICFILTLIRYFGLKTSSDKLYKISQIFAY